MRRELELRISIPDDDDDVLSEEFIQALEAQVDYFREIRPIAFSGRMSKDIFVNHWVVRSVP